MRGFLFKVVLVLFVFGLSAEGFGQEFEWAKSFGGLSEQEGNSITTDLMGNVFTTGYFKQTVDFDPGAGVFNLTPLGAQGIFISKLDANGNFVWVKHIESSGTNEGYSIKTDLSGSIFITGVFRNTADFDPGVGVFNLTALGYQDVFVLKLDANGNFVWAKSLRTDTDNISFSIDIDASGNIYTTGAFQGTVDFDPGISVFNLTTTGNEDVFILKLDNNGNFVWAKGFGGNDEDITHSIAVDDLGYIYTTGYFEGTVDFDPGIGIFDLTSTGTEDIFISKLDAIGDFVWVKNFGKTGGNTGRSITTDGMGNVYSTGNYRDTVDFDPGIGIFNLNPTVAGGGDSYILKLDGNGDFVWAKNIRVALNTSIITDVNENVYTTGYYSTSNSIDFDPGPGSFNLTPLGATDFFILKLDVIGDFVWAKSIGGNFSDWSNSITIDIEGNLFSTGYFRDTVDFNPSIGTFNIPSIAHGDIFILKLKNDTTIQGNIMTSLGNPLQNSKVYLIEHFSSTDSVFATDSTFTDALGFYQFPNTFQNAYVKAVPDAVNYPNEVPTYNISSAVFQNADAVYLSYPFGNTDFSTIAGVNPGGPGFIGGIVGNGAGKNSEVGELLPNINLILINSNNEVVAQTTTDQNGAFQFANLAEESFSIWVDKAGVLNSLAPMISLVEDNNQDDLKFVLHKTYLEDITTVGIENITNSSFKIFPNPTNQSITIQNENITKEYQIELYSILGKQVFSNATRKESLTIDLENLDLSKGTYFIKLTSEKGAFITKVVYR